MAYFCIKHIEIISRAVFRSLSRFSLSRNQIGEKSWDVVKNIQKIELWALSSEGSELQSALFANYNVQVYFGQSLTVFLPHLVEWNPNALTEPILPRVTEFTQEGTFFVSTQQDRMEMMLIVLTGPSLLVCRIKRKLGKTFYITTFRKFQTLFIS